MTNQKIIRIGTRDSELALWQAQKVSESLSALGFANEIIPIKSQGDIVLDKPLYEMGITGIFTKNLDVAMLKYEIDIAVHSMKDVPTQLPKGIVQGAVLHRANPFDILVYKNSLDFLGSPNAVIATGSLRRKAQWLHKYPSHTIENLRGNVNSRLQKLQENAWNGAIFASAGLDRIAKKPENHIVLDWITPAPAQGAILVVAMANDAFSLEALSLINHRETQICTAVERQFLRTLEGGCTAPIGAYAYISEGELYFKGNLVSLCGKQKIEVSKTINMNNLEGFAEKCANEILDNGGRELLLQIASQIQSKNNI